MSEEQRDQPEAVHSAGGARVRSASERRLIRLFTIFFPIAWSWGAWLGTAATLAQFDRFTAGEANLNILIFMLVWCLVWLVAGCAGGWALWRAFRAGAD